MSSDDDELSLIPTSSSDDEMSSSSSDESISWSDIQIDYKDLWGEDLYDQVSAWLVANCQKYTVLHQNRDTHGRCHERSLSASEERLVNTIKEKFPDIDDPTDIVDMWETSVYEGWMLGHSDEAKEKLKKYTTADAIALLRVRYMIATANQNMTEFVCSMLERDPVSPSVLLRIVKYEVSRPGGTMDEWTAAFNFPAADDLFTHSIAT